LLDTDICIFYFKGRYNLEETISVVGYENCFISEITLAELLYGAECSERPDYHKAVVNTFAKEIQIIPIFPSIPSYPKEKARLRKLGTLIDDFDLLIGVTAIDNKCILVTNNSKYFKRLEGIIIEDWIKDER